MNGFINVLKPTGMSSSQAVGFVKKICKLKKVGHAGTLDPLAAGVLPIMLGRATKLFNYLQDHQKEYVCEICFGITTDTLDADGTVIQRCEKIPSTKELDAILPSFMGDIEQVPPKYSALKIQGERMYKLARDGKDFEVPRRKTTVYQLQRLNNIEDGKVRIYIQCQSGFYVRSLCRDIGEALGTAAFMNVLVRQSAGSFTLQKAFTVEELEQMANANDFSFLMPMDDALQHIPSVEVNQTESFALANGRTICTTVNNGLYRIYDTHSLLGIAYAKDQQLKLETILAI
ncbi:MAG: tRNA pseudouridine(55) synthase TruB [Eubacteriales bacterium]|nr:tRNA pseudouridine(55) synthase TruB [Eubacteriales bacterium]